MLRELLEHVVKKIVDKPNAVVITPLQEDGREVFEIRVDEQDLGRVIGREGQTVKALRMLLTSVTPEGKETLLRIPK